MTVDTDTFAKLIGSTAGHKVAEKMLEFLMESFAAGGPPTAEDVQAALKHQMSPILDEAIKSHATFLEDDDNLDTFVKSAMDTFQEAFPRMAHAALLEPHRERRPRTFFSRSLAKA